MTLGIKVSVTNYGEQADEIVVQHAGEELRLYVFRHPRDGWRHAHVAFDAPLTFRILRASLLSRVPPTVDEREMQHLVDWGLIADRARPQDERAEPTDGGA